MAVWGLFFHPYVASLPSRPSSVFAAMNRSSGKRYSDKTRRGTWREDDQKGGAASFVAPPLSIIKTMNDFSACYTYIQFKTKYRPSW